MIDPKTLLARNDAILFSEIGNDVVALSVERGECFGMEEVSADVWRMLETPASAADIFDRLVQDYEVEPGRCHQEVGKLLGDMLARGLIRPIG